MFEKNCYVRKKLLCSKKFKVINKMFEKHFRKIKKKIKMFLKFYESYSKKNIGTKKFLFKKMFQINVLKKFYKNNC